MILRKQENDKRRQGSLRSPSGLPPPGFISSRARFNETTSERLLCLSADIQVSAR